jgi:hypothetical protein
VLPVDVNRTVVRFQWHSYEPLPNPETDARWNELARFSEKVQAEDAHICGAIQLNIGLRAYQPRPYSPKRAAVSPVAGLLLNGGRPAGLTPVPGESQALSRPGGFFIVRAFQSASCPIGDPTTHAPAD